MKKLTTFFLTVLVLLVLIGCATPEHLTAVADDISPTFNATDDQATAPPSFTKIPTSGDLGQFRVEVKCPTIEDSISDSFNMIGTLVISSSPSSISMLTPSSGTEVQVKNPDIQMGAGSVSPDGKVFAYPTGDWKNKTFNLVFSDNHNNILKTIPWNEAWYLIGGWINSGQLAILAYEQKLELVSPYTNQQETISTVEIGFPNYSTYNLGRPWVLFSPNMKRAVYSDYSEQILLDVENREELATVPRYVYELAEAAWSKDGSSVAIIGQNEMFIGNHQSSREEVYILTQDGINIQVTNFADLYKTGVLIYRPSWSPDGSSIAFWIYSESYGDPYYRLAIFNLRTSAATLYCLSSDLSGGIHTNWYTAPLWSPDSKQIMIESRLGDIDNVVIVLDISTNKAVNISIDSQPIGWMSP